MALCVFFDPGKGNIPDDVTGHRSTTRSSEIPARKTAFAQRAETRTGGSAPRCRPGWLSASLVGCNNSGGDHASGLLACTGARVRVGRRRQRRAQ